MSLTANSVGLFAGTLAESPKAASDIIGTFIMPFMLFSGFYTNVATYMSWIGWI